MSEIVLTNFLMLHYPADKKHCRQRSRLGDGLVFYNVMPVTEAD